ncbi:tumor necrosis factor receptor superfamily member 1A [Triplophysa rosa]|uniref:Tumor necrosis factor receptor superfamily member 1A n=1 Tax=Triplophysa rosa TaxID=992332 RepID=A0A9W7WRJ7_TRIRA|nr:tumor necrosis factor receptor superfamily member 1A [Triplophysa rosa]KAI7807038.1 tumor necrosis factor receptor superfamily member 1A precursor [Triplophysa rosa]
MTQHNTTHRRKHHLSICLLLVLFCQSYVVGQGQCSENEYWNDQGFCCDKCHAGFKLIQKCPALGQRSVCKKCDAGTYSEKANFYRNCFKCTSCKKPNMVTVSNCTVTSNSTCKCNDGYYMKKLTTSTLECRLCKNCGPGQWKIGNCTGEDYNHCMCKDKHYSVKPNSCEPCVRCQEGCGFLCNSSKTLNTVRSPTTDTVSQIVVPVCSCIMAVAVGVFMLYEGIRLWRKRKRALSAQSSPHDPVSMTEVETMVVTDSPDSVMKHVPKPCETERASELPDCVPREIKVAEFIYFVLDEIPVARFKEVVRRLGISEQDIDRAERDNRAFKDAQYQMLKVWSDRGSGGGNNILPCHLIQLFIDTLGDMFLASCADSIENRFLS